MARLRNWFPLFSFALLGLIAVGLGADWWIARPADAPRKYVGRETCATCHQKQLKDWTGSHHDLAMDLATPETVLGDFNNQELTHFGVTSKMFREGDKYFITTEGRTGEMETFPIKYTFGVDPLQQYMVEMERGRVQVLSIAWDTRGKRWFHLYQDEKIPAGDWLHWTGAGQNWNYMCAECHSTDLQKNYDLKTDTYHTTWKEIDVSCEACHGPGSLHVDLANSKSLFWDRVNGYGLARLKDKSNKNEIETCARCHSRRRIVHDDYHPGRNFLDYYEPELLDGELYHVDGQIREEVYEYGSFVQSLMHRKGVRCSNCHEPHKTTLRFEGNKLCGQCHIPGKYDSPSHHHHKVDGKGASCVECHMPETKYMVVDPRRDHSIRVPRPDLTVQLGAPNACNGCHKDKSPEWASERVVNWYGPKRRDDPHYALGLSAARNRKLEKPLHESKAQSSATNTDKPDPQLVEREIIDRLATLSRKQDTGTIVRASAVALLGRYPSPKSLEVVEKSLTSTDPEVRLSAIRATDSLLSIRAVDVYSLDQLPAEQSRVLESRLEELTKRIAPLLRDAVRSVRIEAARTLSIVPRRLIGGGNLIVLDTATEEFKTGQLATADQAGAHLNLGVLYGNQQDFDKAESAYRQAIAIEPDFVPARINLAMQYDQQGRKRESEELLREVTKLAPNLADGHYSLGLLLAEKEDGLAAAAESLATAAKLAPDNPRMHYNLGLARQSLGEAAAAETALKRAYELQPDSADFLHALTIFYAGQQRWPKAIACAEEMIRRFPEQPQLKKLLAELQEEAKAPQPVGPQPR